LAVQEIKSLIDTSTRSIVLLLHAFNVSLLRSIIGVTLLNAYKFYLELFIDAKFWIYIKKQIQVARKREKKVAGWIDFTLLPFLYICVRTIKPRFVVETGVDPGASSAVILKALEKTNREIYTV